MHRLLILASLLIFTPAAIAQSPTPSDWREKVDQALPLLGHRNWIVIADSAYPQQSSPGIDVVETSADQAEVLRYVLGAVTHSIHVRPDILMDAELPFVPESDAPGVTAYRDKLAKTLAGRPVQSIPHEKLIAELDQSSKGFRVLILKTRLTIPYTTVFLRLNCKYWSDDAEKRLRAKVAGAQ